MKLFENRDSFHYVTTLPIEDCKARLKSLKWQSDWIRPHPTVNQLDKDTYTITYASIQGKLSLTTNNERSTHISGEFRLKPDLLILAWGFAIFCALFVFIGGNLFGAIVVILIGCFFHFASIEQYKNATIRLQELIENHLTEA